MKKIYTEKDVKKLVAKDAEVYIIDLEEENKKSYKKIKKILS